MLDPRKMGSNGRHFNWSLIRVGPLGLKAHIPRKDSCIQGLPDVPRDAPADRESGSALAELLSGSTLADQSYRGMLFVLGLLIPVFFFVRPVIPWDAVCVRLHLLSNPMLGFSALPLATVDAGTPGWPIQVSPG